jgi:hypothetical protein
MKLQIRVMPFVALLAAAACSDSSSTEPLPGATTDSIVVNAAQGTAFVRLGSPARLVTVSDATTSNEWDIAFFATTITLNGGAAGPGSVTGFCVCARSNASDDAIRTLTPLAALPDFENITSSSVPADDAFRSDQLSPAIATWFSGSGASATVLTDRAFILREGTTTAILSKLRITGVQQASAANAGQITFQFATQAAPGAAFGAPQTRTVDVRNGAVYFDLTSGQVSTSANWDLRFEGFQIRTNGGVSGGGTLGAIPEMTMPFEQIDAAYAATAPAQAYRRDAFSGVFAQQPWYRYNITGTDNQIWPTFNVYLIKRGNEVYKVQLIGYYGPAGESRIITMRYARLR